MPPPDARGRRAHWHPLCKPLNNREIDRWATSMSSAAFISIRPEHLDCDKLNNHWPFNMFIHAVIMQWLSCVFLRRLTAKPSTFFHTHNYRDKQICLIKQFPCFKLFVQNAGCMSLSGTIAKPKALHWIVDRPSLCDSVQCLQQQ